MVRGSRDSCKFNSTRHYQSKGVWSETIRVRDVVVWTQALLIKVICRVPITIPYVVRGINYTKGGAMWITLYRSWCQVWLLLSCKAMGTSFQ